MSTIKKYLLVLILLLVLTACNSNNNAENITTNSTSQIESSQETEITQKETELSSQEETETESDTLAQEVIQDNKESTIDLIENSPSDSSIEESTSSTESGQHSNSNITSNEDNTKVSWSFKRNSEHKPVVGYNEGVDLAKFDSYYLGDTSKKEIYLTFDEGYEYGYSASILDTLKANNVKATFFLTKDFIKSEPELCKRMAQEGHTVGNHSVTHPSFPSLTDEELIYEVEEAARYYKEVTGYDMDKFLRPPKGEFSARTLDIIKQLNYKTVFWSLAYVDWNVDNQPGKEVAYKNVIDNYHNGGIFLLHAVSQSNAEALDDIIKTLKSEGYTLLSIKDLQ